MKFLQLNIGEIEARVLLAAALRQLGGSLEVTEDEFADIMARYKAAVYKEAEDTGGGRFKARMSSGARIQAVLEELDVESQRLLEEMAVVQ